MNRILNSFKKKQDDKDFHAGASSVQYAMSGSFSSQDRDCEAVDFNTDDTKDSNTGVCS